MKLQSLLLLTLLAGPAAAMDIPANWTAPVEPFRVVGNIYYIGTAELSSWLIVTPEGYVLVDAPLGGTTLEAWLTPGHTKGNTT